MRRCWATLLTFAVLAGCSTNTPERTVVLSVSPDRSTLDQPFTIEISGLAAGQHAVIGASTTSSTGATWASSATFVADGRGDVDLRRDTPVAGSYRTRDAIGLLWSMRRRSGPRMWGSLPPPDGATVRITVRAEGDLLAATTVRRVITDPMLHPRRYEVGDAGFAGDLFSAPTSSVRGPAVILLGGSEGGIPGGASAAMLASRGYTTLALAYFGHPGLPPALSDVPLDHMAAAARWLARQPGVDAQRVIVLGYSRGAEAALLLGAAFPEVVHGVIAFAPSDVINGPFPEAGAGDSGLAWTLGGVPIIRAEMISSPEIPVERINGPVLLFAGADDHVWDGPGAVRRIEDRLVADGFRHAHEGHVYAGVDHNIGPPSLSWGVAHARATNAAAVDSWRRVLAFLDRL